ncbi:MAG: AglZ/HisF2 family acetamidino modification protein [Chitinophagaceae bacterium]|nr:AglZ/HisF2 family acetamidino modification protein [Chitinophagaceae bacterium]
MNNFRIIPILLYRDGGLYKSVKFKNHNYIGDPINTVKIFNDKEVDELIILDISDDKLILEPNYSLIKELATECFMPICYGGKISNIEQIRKILSLGVEKVAINTNAVLKPDLIKRAVEEFGSSTIVISTDVKKNIWGAYEIHINNGKKNTKIDPFTFVKKMEAIGAGEILINSIDRDGMMLGYDIELITRITSIVNLPIIACGGAGSLNDFKNAIYDGKASAVAAGSMFVYHGKLKGVLINYPSQLEIKSLSL